MFLGHSYILNQLLTIKFSKAKLVTHFLTSTTFKNKIIRMTIINEPHQLGKTVLTKQLDTESWNSHIWPI